MGTGSAYAQSSESVQAQIPFDFKVGRTTLPAGEYRVKYDPAEEPGLLTVRSADGHREVFVLTQPVAVRKDRSNADKLVFEREGTRYVLSEVFTEDSSTGLEILGAHPAD
jgi:hypothetical protein